jgi:cytochrome P450
MEVGGVRLEPGDVLMMLPRLVGIDETHFPEPLAYRPERWLAGSDASQDVRRKVFPFGGGPRFCPGRYLAMVEMKMVAAMTLRRFELAVDPTTNAGEHFTFTMGPEALALRLETRSGTLAAATAATAAAAAAGTSSAV